MDAPAGSGPALPLVEFETALRKHGFDDVLVDATKRGVTAVVAR